MFTYTSCLCFMMNCPDLGFSEWNPQVIPDGSREHRPGCGGQSEAYTYTLIIIQIWDLASGTLKLSLTGHVSTVRGVVVSPRQPYLFSCGEDKMVRCWDLEYNKVRVSKVNDVMNQYYIGLVTLGFCI